MTDQLTGQSKLVGPIVKLAKQKIIQAKTIDVLGERCSVRLSGNGALLTGLYYTGVAPKKDQIVQVDYRSGVPRVLTVSSNLDQDIQAVVGTQLTSQSQAAYNVPPGPPLPVPSADIPLSITDGVTTVPSAYQVVFPEGSVTQQEDGIAVIEIAPGLSISDGITTIAAPTQAIFPAGSVTEQSEGVAVIEMSAGELLMYELNVAELPAAFPDIQIDGALAAVDDVFTWIAKSDGRYDGTQILVLSPGDSGTTTIDVKLNGVSVYAIAPNPTYAFDSSGVLEYSADYPTYIARGDVLTLQITSVAVNSGMLIVSPILLGYNAISWLTDEFGEIMVEE